MGKKKRKLKVNPSTGAVIGYVLLGAGVLAAAGMGVAYAMGTSMKKLVTGIKDEVEKESEAIEDEDSPALEPTGSADVQSKEVRTLDQAIQFVGVDIAERAIRTNRPAVYMMVGEEDFLREGEDGYDTLFKGMMDFEPRNKGPMPHRYTIVVNGPQQPRGEVLLGAIYPEDNGAWAATRPAPDMRWIEGKGGRQATAFFPWLADIIAQEDFASDTAELPPEVVAQVRDGKSIPEAMRGSKGPQQA